MGSETTPAEKTESARTPAAPEQDRAAESGSTLSSPVLAGSAIPPAGPHRNLALLRTQQTRGNRFTQGVVAQIQRSPAPTKEGPADSGSPDLHLLPQGQPLAEDARADMEPRFQADFSSVRVHTDGDAAAAADTLGARAFTLGRDIYFASGTYSPASGDGQRLLAHELVHTLQQPDAPALAPRVPVSSPDDVMEHEAEEISEAALAGDPLKQPSPAPATIARAPVPTSSAMHPAEVGVNAQAYVALHSTEIVGYLGYDLSFAEIEIPTPFVAWREGSQRQFLIDCFAPYWARKNDLWNQLTVTLAPDSPERAVDQGRDVWPFKLGPPEWQGAVLGELYKLVVKRLHESLARIVPRWRAIKNQLELMVEGGDMAGDREPSKQEVFASHPMDTYVIGALPGKLNIDYLGYRKAFPEVAAQRVIRSGLRPVTFDFQMGSGAWNWIRVTSPKDPTPEEVAKTLFGDEAQAYTLTTAPPLFGFENINQLLKVHQRRWDKEGVKENTDPSEPPPMYEETAATQIMAGPLADEAALAQARNAKPDTNKGAAPPGASAGVLDRMRAIVRSLDRMVKEYSSLHASLFPAETFEPTRDRVDARSKRLSSATPAEVAAWDTQSIGQLELVNSAESGLMMAKEQSEAFKEWKSAAGLAQGIGHRYALVAQNSDLVETGRALLNDANEQSRLYPVDLMDLLLVELREALAASHTDKTGVVDAETRENIYQTSSMEARASKLRAQLVKVRDLVIQHPEQAKAALKPLFDEIQDLQVEVTLTTNMDECDRAWRALFDSTSVVGEIRAGLGDVGDVVEAVAILQPPSWEHGNAVLRHAARDAGQMNLEWNAILQKYRYGDAKQKAEALEELKTKSKSPEWTGFMEHIRQVINDQATYDKWMTFALMVGIALVTAGIGTYVEAAAGAAWGAWAGFAVSTVTEAAAFTSMSYLLVNKDPTVGGFFADFGKNVLTFGGLKIVGRLYRLGVGAEFAASLPGKAGEVLTSFAALNGSALYMADRDMRAKTGHGLSWSQISEISIGNIGFVIATAIGAKLSEPVFKDLQLKGELQGRLAKVENTRLQLMDLSKQVESSQGKDPALTKQMLAKQSELVEAEHNALSRLEEIAADPKKAAAAGLTAEQSKSLASARGELVDALARLNMARAVKLMEPIGPNEVAVQKGKPFDEVKQAFDKPPESTVGEVREDPVTHTRSVEIKAEGEEPLVVSERTAEKGVVSKPPEAVPEGEPPEPEPVASETEPPAAKPTSKRVRPPRRGQVTPDNIYNVPEMPTLLRRMHDYGQIFNRSISFNDLGYKDPQALADFINRNPKTAIESLNRSLETVVNRFEVELGIDPQKAFNDPHRVIKPDIPPPDNTGQTPSARIGTRVHAERAAARRAAGTFDLVNQPITDANGKQIMVPDRVDLKTGAPAPDAEMQIAKPDAVDYKAEMFLDDKPAGRPISADRQEMIRNIEAYRIRTGKLPKTIEIHRYDPATEAPAGIEIYTPQDFLP
ncbi:MAG TPA: DUF4157 domain-containing protein [Bryobacteraceae bacterium]|jgi:hypothetical protein